jgi:hypothetical protein
VWRFCRIYKDKKNRDTDKSRCRKSSGEHSFAGLPGLCLYRRCPVPVPVSERLPHPACCGGNSEKIGAERLLFAKKT